jgi:predicted nucleic acid-binding Zn ribbon protein
MAKCLFCGTPTKNKKYCSGECRKWNENRVRLNKASDKSIARKKSK